MNEESRLVDKLAIAVVDDIALVIESHQVRALDEGERYAERVDPECIGLHRILSANISVNIRSV